MAKISQYAPAGTVTGDDLLVMVDVHDTTMASSGTDKKLLVSQLTGSTSTVSLAVNGQFSTSAPANSTVDGWADWTDFPGPSLSSAWTASTIIAANGSGGTITFPTFSGYTPTPYAAPSANAPAGNAGFFGWSTASVGSLVLSLGTVNAGTACTFSFWYAGNAAQSSLNWYIAAGVQDTTGYYGNLRLNFPFYTQWVPNLTTGWQQYTGTWTAVTTGPAYLQIYGIGTDAVIANGNASTISGATVAAPVLIGAVQFSIQTGSTGTLITGSGLGTVAAGNDTRFPHLDIFGLVVPRTERIDLTWPVADGYNTATVSQSATPRLMPPGLSAIAFMSATVGTLSQSVGDHVTFDVLCGGSSILAGTPATITSTAWGSGGVARPLAFQDAGSSPLTVQILSSQGSIGDLTIALWVNVTG